MNAREIVSVLLLAIGGFFFFAGTVGLLRFPDVYTRLHALTKADNLGLGFLVAGLALQADTFVVAAKLGITWALVVVASSISCQLVAGAARRGGVRPKGPA